MILNWSRHLKFPVQPKISPEAIDLLKLLLCEPEHRLGSQVVSSVLRSNSVKMSVYGLSKTTRSVDGADKIKSHPWFKGIDWGNIHRVKAPYRPNLRDPADTKHFDDDIPAETLPAANGGPPDATKDPLLKDILVGDKIMDSRKQYAFVGFTHKSPRAITYPRVDTLMNQHTPRGRNVLRVPSARSRALSL